MFSINPPIAPNSLLVRNTGAVVCCLAAMRCTTASPQNTQSHPTECLRHHPEASLFVPHPHEINRHRSLALDHINKHRFSWTRLLMPRRDRKQQQPPQPKAWQGPNPITQRASTANVPNGTNGAEKPLPKTPAASQSQPSQQMKSAAAETNGDKHAHDRALFLLANCTVRSFHVASLKSNRRYADHWSQGLDATLTLKSGEQFTGVFSGGSFESTAKHQYILKMVKQTRPPSQQQTNGATETPSEYVGEGEDHVMMFDKEDTVDLAVTDVVTANAAPLQNGASSSHIVWPWKALIL